MSDSWSQVEVLVIPNTLTQSGKFGVGGFGRGSFLIPPALTGTTITVEVSNDALTWDAVRAHGGTAVPAQTVTVDQIYLIPAEAFSSRFARLVSGSAEGADRTFKVNLGTD